MLKWPSSIAVGWRSHSTGGWEQMPLNWPLTSLGVVPCGPELCYLCLWPLQDNGQALTRAPNQFLWPHRKSARGRQRTSWFPISDWSLTFCLGIRFVRGPLCSPSKNCKVKLFYPEIFGKEWMQIFRLRAGGSCKCEVCKIWEMNWSHLRSHVVFPGICLVAENLLPIYALVCIWDAGSVNGFYLVVVNTQCCN